jgi:DNA modification methylase
MPMKDKSAQCCVTSPPYWGLRDYGTAKWKGGEEDCDHTVSQYSDAKNAGVGRPFRGDKSHCLKCGAIRVDNQLGLEATPEEYVDNMVQVFREVWRVLKDDGTLWLNLGDSYNGSGGAGGDYSPGGLKDGQPKYPGRNISHLKPKDLVGIPWRVAFALQADGWWLRQDIIWHKPNPMPESVKDRCTKAHEYVFLLSKSKQYFYDHEAIKEQSVTNEDRPAGIVRDRVYGYDSKQSTLRSQRDKFKRSGNKNGQPEKPQKRTDKKNDAYNTLLRNKRSVWKIATKPYKGSHFATFPPKLVEPMILAGSRVGDIVLDPFFGSGTTGLVATMHNRKHVGLELNPDYIELARERLAEVQTRML